MELLEAEVGRDTLEVMGERSRAQQLAQQVANMTQQLAAQRCVATFLGSNEQSLRDEIAALRKVSICQRCRTNIVAQSSRVKMKVTGAIH